MHKLEKPEAAKVLFSGAFEIMLPGICCQLGSNMSYKK